MVQQDSFQIKLMQYFNQMDFRSQAKAQHIFKFAIIFAAILSYTVGFLFQKFSYCVYSTLVVMVLCLIFVVPGQLPWWKKPLPDFIKVKRD